MRLVLPRWFDLHAHFRQGANVCRYIADHLAMGCAGALAMPNTQPPVATPSGPESDKTWSIASYRDMLLAAGADAFEQLLIPLYLTRDTNVAMIQEGAEAGLLRAAKYYPPHGTTNSEHGVPMAEWIGSDVFHAMEDLGTVLCIHGEQHGLKGSDYFDRDQTAEAVFYQEIMPRLIEKHPRLRIVCEHITTAVAAEFVSKAPDTVAATITPQHLLFTTGHLLQGLRYHLYCLPLAKFEADRASLRGVILRSRQTKFFAGTDSAPHSKKMTECGCAAGCYTGGCAPQLYAMAFEEAGADLAREAGRDAFVRFLCTNGPAYYGFPASDKTFALTRTPSQTIPFDVDAGQIVPLPYGMQMELSWSIEETA